MDRVEAPKWIASEAAKLDLADDERKFVEVVEIELMSLHEGNFARYRIRPSQFDRWKKDWKK